jgi:AAHS family 4-hydroxybenzoate transporter-like MFS transporter
LAQTIHVDRLVDEQKIDWFNINLFIWSFLAMFGDGYDISAMAFAAPDLVRDWGLHASTLGPAFSASLFGILFGAPLLGYLGDRYGRKPAIIGGCLIYGLCTLAIMQATSLNQIIVLRFLTGLGIGGLMPNTISLNSELSPRRLRATLTVLMFTGITLGSGTPSVVAAWLVPHYGWKVLFWWAAPYRCWSPRAWSSPCRNLLNTWRSSHGNAGNCCGWRAACARM